MLIKWIKQKIIKQLIRNTYQNIDGFGITKAAIKKHKLDSPEFTYGEICFHTFLQALDIAKVNSGDVFYDLGSGVGKNTIIAALYADFKESIGIELLQESQQTSINCYKQLENNFFAKKLLGSCSVTFVQADMRDVDFSDADIIFINATALA